MPSFEISADILLVFLYLALLKARQNFLMLIKMSAGISKDCWFHGPRIISAASNVVF